MQGSFRMTLENVKAYLDEWGVAYVPEPFFDEFDSVSFSAIRDEKEIIVHAFKHDLWVMPRNRIDQGLKIYSFSNKQELADTLTSIGVFKVKPSSVRRRCFWCI